MRHLDGPHVPALIVTAELDPLPMQAEGAILFPALSERDEAYPDYVVLRDHNHISEICSINTPDEALSEPVLEFIICVRAAGLTRTARVEGARGREICRRNA